MRRIKLKEYVENALKLYALTLALPISLSILSILFCGVLGIPSKVGFWGGLKVIWIDFYFTGSLLDIAAWRWQIVILTCSFLASSHILTNK